MNNPFFPARFDTPLCSIRQALFVLPLITASMLFASPRPLVTGITAEIASHGGILLSWTMPRAVGGNGEDTSDYIEQVLIFRAAAPITSFEQIATIAPKATLDARSSWLDKTPLKGDGYYAVVLVTDGKRFPVIIPSVNATINGIAPHRRRKTSRILPVEDDEMPRGAIPLPSAAMEKKDMSEKAQDEAFILSLQGKGLERKQLAPYIFKDDLIESESGEEVFLFNVLKTTFIKCKYSEAASELSRLLRTNMARNVTMRTTFYLGECYYFMGQYEKAISKFMDAKSYYSPLERDTSSALPPASSAPVNVSSLCNSWIDSSLLLLSMLSSES